MDNPVISGVQKARRAFIPAGLLLLPVLLASCAGLPGSSKQQVPAEDRSESGAGVPPSIGPPGPEETFPPPSASPAAAPLPAAAPEQPDVAPVAARPPAVSALLQRADVAEKAGKNAEAAAELERALRIAPRDGELWLRLGRVRLRQRQWQQAESTGLKCVSLAESDAPTRQAAWELIGSARAARGDAAGAAAARRRAAAVIP